MAVTVPLELLRIVQVAVELSKSMFDGDKTKVTAKGTLVHPQQPVVQQGTRSDKETFFSTLQLLNNT